MGIVCPQNIECISPVFGRLKNLVRRVRIANMRHKAASCPLPKWIDGEGTTLIVAPHPDDEVLGCGGLIARLCDSGHAPHIVYMTGGGGSHRGCCGRPEEEVVAARRRLTSLAMSVLGVPPENLHFLDYPDGGISADNEQTDRLRALVAELAPQYILVPHWGEGWPDHIRTAAIVKEIAAATGIRIYEYCVWLWYYNVNNLDWDTARTLPLTQGELARKQSAADIYTLPLAPCGRPWSGVLPDVFLKAHKGNRELYFKCMPEK